MTTRNRVLLVEDDRFLRRAGEVALRKAGIDVITAVDGEDALRIARAETPDLILLDVVMPRLNGFEVLRALKDDPATRRIDVIMLSNLRQEADVAAAMAAGARDYLVKANLSLSALTEAVGKALGEAV
jgi:DNA-binding response OmpR family regulator